VQFFVLFHGEENVTAWLGLALGGIFHDRYLALAGALRLFAPSVTGPLFSCMKIAVFSSIVKFLFLCFSGKGLCGGTREQLGSQMDPSISALLDVHLVPFGHPLCLLVVSIGRAARSLPPFEQSVFPFGAGVEEQRTLR